MARMKIEFLHHYRRHLPLSQRDRLIAYLPRYAPHAARVAPLLNLRNRVPFLAQLGERQLGFSAARNLPQWSAQPYRGGSTGHGREVVLLVDTFNRYFEPENARAAERVLTSRRLSHRQSRSGARPAIVLWPDFSCRRSR